MYPFWLIILGPIMKRRGLPPVRVREVVEITLAGIAATLVLFFLFRWAMGA
jgi:hypothetical protein